MLTGQLYNYREILKEIRTIAVVGLSPKKERPSYQVASYLLAAGFEIIPVNPGQEEILGRRCYPSLAVIPGPVDLVDIFRKSEEVPAVVAAAIAIKAKVIWMQQGIVHPEAAQAAERAGLAVVMDRCLMVEHRNLSKPQPHGNTRL